ncbi:YhgE/Pip domain-containing protein [Propionimicrobium lymphophilum]|uniref:YhgE/Pip domain-containing protein n=1 Tax=Propionimicrobium lymphophilum TaxID=33012 RepID=UPI0023F23483|nr:YhgE/Pip domain-containing protein [Propionimicrobium lymphophilum]
MKKRKHLVANIVVVTALVLIPLLYASVLTSAYHDNTANISRVTAAVVNEDEPAQFEGQRLAVGQSLTEKLLAGDGGFSWKQMESQEADDALAEGKVRAVLKIPANFSAAVAGLGDFEKEPEATQLSLTTDDGVNYLSGTLAATVAANLENSLTSEIASQYIYNVLNGFGIVDEKLADAQNGVAQLSDGSARLTSGLSELENGAVRADAAGVRLADGATKIQNGADSLANGSVQLRDGLQASAPGAEKLADASGRLAQGTQTMNGYMPELVSATDRLASGSAKLVGGLASFAEALSRYTTGADQLAAGIGELNAKMPALQEGAAKLGQGSADLNSGLASLSDNSVVLAQKLGQAKAGASELQTGVTQAANSIQQLSNACAALHTGQDPICVSLANLNEQLPQAVAGTQKLTSGVAQASQAAGQLSAGAKSLYSGSEALNQGVQSLVVAIGGEDDGLVGGVNRLNVGANKLVGPYDEQNKTRLNSSALIAGFSEISDGSSELASGMKALDSKVPRLANAANALGSGSQQIASGSAALASAQTRLLQGANDLAAGQGSLASGVGELSFGSRTLSEGLTSLKQASSTAKQGSGKIDDGLNSLKDGIQEGRQSLPKVSAEQAQDRADVAASAAQVNALRNNPVNSNGAGFAPMFMTLAMWVGGIGIFMVIPAVDRRLKNKPWRIAVGRTTGTAILLGVAQAVLISLGSNWLLGLGTENLPALVAVCLAGSLAFVIFNQACVAVFGFRGRFISLVLIVLQIGSMGATFPIETSPQFFQVIRPWLPMTYVSQGIRAAISGGGANNAISLALLFSAGMLLMSIALVALATWRRWRYADKQEKLAVAS